MKKIAVLALLASLIASTASAWSVHGAVLKGAKAVVTGHAQGAAVSGLVKVVKKAAKHL